MKLFNSLSQELEVFRPINENKVKLYTCGPTVYDHVHIGNLRTYVFEDILRRTLRYEGYQVEHVMNITDVDDKTIRRSREKFPDADAHDALRQLTREYEKLFLADAGKLSIDLDDSKIARATEHINEMLELIRAIPNKYIGDDGIYYDLDGDPKYGVLVKLDRAHAHHRINNDEYDKEHVADFALWKKESPGEPAWHFELDGQELTGRPGWHIECSAMSVKYLGQPFDIHTGGVDLKFPHHENEIAQSRAAAGKPLANYFVHAEHLLVDGHKMAKSLGNFYTLADIRAKDYDPVALRLLFLQAHYRSQLNFTWDSLDAAAANLKTIQDWADLVHQQPGQANDTLVREMRLAMADDLNTAEALARLNQVLDGAGPSPELLVELDQLLGLKLSDRQDITEEQKELLAHRQAAKERKDYTKADSIRATLKASGITVRDTQSGQIWSRL